MRRIFKAQQGRLRVELLETRLQPGDMLFTGLSGSAVGSELATFSPSEYETDDLTSLVGSSSLTSTGPVELLPASELTVVQAPASLSPTLMSGGPSADGGLGLAIVAGRLGDRGLTLTNTPMEAAPITSMEVVSTVQATPLPAGMIRRLETQVQSGGSGAEDATLVYGVTTDDLGLANGVAVNAAGEAFIAATVFPGATDETNGVVFKLNAAGDTIVCGVEIGDGGFNGATGVSVVGGNVFVTGYVDPNDGSFEFGALALKMSAADCSNPTGLLIGGDGLTVTGYGIAGLASGKAIVVGQTIAAEPPTSGLMARVNEDFATLDYGINVVFNASNTGIFGVNAPGDGFHYGTGFLTQPDGTKPLIYKIADPIPDPLALAWGVFYPGAVNGSGSGVTTDATGAYMTGIFNNTANQLLVKHNRDTGAQIYGFAYAQEGGFIGGTGIAADGTGHVYTSGYLFETPDTNLNAALLKFAPTGDSVVDAILLGVEGGVAVGTGVAYNGGADNAAYMSGYASPDFAFFSPLAAKANNFLP